MERNVLKKIIVMAIVFVITFSHCGFTLQALATSDGLTIFGFTLFEKSKLNFKAYFLDENGKEVDEASADVNGSMTLVLELEPKETGYLKTGTIQAITDNGEPNFEFNEILNISSKTEKEEQKLQQMVQLDQTLLQTGLVVDSELPEVELTLPVQEEANSEPEELENVADLETTIPDGIVEEENTIQTNTVIETNEVINNTVEDNTVIDVIPSEITIPEEEILVDEEEVYQEESKEKEETIVMPVSTCDAKISSANEILIENVVDFTKIYVKLTYKAGEKVKVEDLFKETSLEMVGTYINKDLEEVPVSYEDEITTEWTYTKDVLVSSEITKVSPFEVEGTKGTLVENKIILNRNCDEENYLPLKETVIEFEAPKINGKAPIDLDVRANKLKATLGEEVNEITFSSDNWNYDSNKNTITIKLENPEAILTEGEDIYVITYRYDEYVESEEITVDIKGTVSVEEYSGKKNNKITKDFSDRKTTVVNIGELITYSIGTTEDLLPKGKINANYNSVEAVYETEFISTVDINILTNDVLKEFTLKDTKEYYIDKTNLEFEAQDVKYRSLKFRYDEIYPMLEQGGTIEIRSNMGDVLYTLNSSSMITEDNCEFDLAEDIHGVEISARDIKVNGTITIDFRKTIGKCAYEKATFTNFEKIESRVKAEVKYGTSDEIIELTPLKTEKYFEKSYTKAEITMNKDQLSTIMDNDNVELKIELFNNTENSDLYINPEFEVVFPSFIQDVEVKSVNLLYEEGLSVKNISLFKDANNIQRMKIQIEGVQREFSTSDITNGTNIIINTKIVVDDYTPKREDQLKMYYFNQGVTNYQSQTDWKISTPIMDGLIKQTNGFDLEVFSFQAPSGFVTANGIENYDGLGSSIDTIKQGEVIAKAEMGEIPRVVTMKLAALNNTGNKCTDVVMLGRIPHTEATDIITGEKLGTNRNTQIVSEIVQDSINPIGCDIYYSYNGDATQSLSDGKNAWIKTPEDMSQVKSFLIVPTGAVEPGTLFKFTYDYQIPANLPYEVKMYGDFGAYYNNHSDIAIAYESTKADLVGLVTDEGPKLDASLSVDIGDGAKIQSGKRLKYTVTVVNSGSITATGITINAPIPAYTSYVVQDESRISGDYGFEVKSDKRELTFEIQQLEPGQTREFSYYVQVNKKGSEKAYVKNKVLVECNILADSIETNEVTNEIQKSYFDTSIKIKFDRELREKYESEFSLSMYNTSGQDLSNVVVVFNAGKIYELMSGEVNNEAADVTYNPEEGKIYFNIGNMPKEKIFTIKLFVIAKKINTPVETCDCYFEIKSNEMEIAETTTAIPQVIKRAMISAKDVTLEKPSTVKEGETIVVSTEIVNYGEDLSTGNTYECQIPDSLEVEKVLCNQTIKLNNGGNSGYILDTLPVMEKGKTIIIDMYLKAKNMPGIDSSKVVLNRIVKAQDQNDINIEPIEFTILNTEKTKEEIEKEKVEENEKAYEEAEAKYKEEQERKKEEERKQLEEQKKQQEELKKKEEKKQQEEQKKQEEEQKRQEEIKKQQEEQKRKEEEQKKQEQQKEQEEQKKQEEIKAPTQPTQPTQPATPEETKPAVVEETPKYSISGQAWLDENKNGVREDEEKSLSSIKVYLLTVGYKMLKSTTTNNNGMYQFNNIENGKYIIAFAYDTELYVATIYKKMDAGEDRNSDVIENDSEKMNAISNSITLENGNIEHIDIGLQNRDTFDLQINKRLSKITVTTSKGTKTYDYDKVDLAKVDIHSKEIKGAKVDLEYVISLENAGSVAGYADQVVDYIGKDIEFNDSINTNWYKGNDGYIYLKNINQVNLYPGQTKEFKLNVTKTMTGENTGTVSNKAEILKAQSNSAEVEKTENNSSVQNTIVTVSTGKTFQTVIIIIFILAVITGLGYKGILPITINYKKVYKTNDKKINLKKFYK